MKTAIGLCVSQHIPVTARSKTWMCGRSPAEIAGSNPTRDMDFSLVTFVCCQVERSMRRADHSSRGGLPNVMYLNVIVKSQK